MIMKKLLGVLLIFIGLVSCKQDKTASKLKERISESINIEQFLVNNQKIDTLELNIVSINKIFDYDYVSYSRYDTQLIDYKKGCVWGNDYLITGMDEKGNEDVLTFYTQNPNKGAEIFGKTFVNKPINEILFHLKTEVKEHSHERFYTTFKNGYNILMCADTDSIITSVSILKSKEGVTVDRHLNRVNLYIGHTIKNKDGIVK